MHANLFCIWFLSEKREEKNVREWRYKVSINQKMVRNVVQNDR